MLEFILPFPPTTNNLFMNIPKRGRIKSKSYRAWEVEADKYMMLHILKHNAQLIGDVQAEYIFGRPDKRRRDVTNFEKAIGDTIVRFGILKDDSQIVDIRLRWGTPEDVSKGMVHVRLKQLG